jgi:hypothetical protein
MLKISLRMMNMLVFKIKKLKIYLSRKLNSIRKREKRKNFPEVLLLINLTNPLVLTIHMYRAKDLPPI